MSEWLYAEGPRFDFFQAVRLLELGHPPEASVGAGVEPSKEAVRFRSAVRLDFPADDIASVTPPECPLQHAGCTLPPERHLPVMSVNFMGLAGEHGPLPKPFTELILGRLWQKDTALRDFLDIFNHRLVSLLYRIRKLHRFGLDARAPGEERIAGYVYAALGLGTPALRDQIHDRPLLNYAGLLAQQPRSMVGLERMLSDYFGVGVEGEQFKGRWVPLERGQWTSIGRRGRNNRLGEDAVVGTRVWDQQGAFELRLGPLTLEQLRDFLPVGWGFGPLCELVRFYAGDDLDYSFRLVLAAGEVRESRLGKAGWVRLGSGRWGATRGARLGWTSWLGSGRAKKADEQVTISPASIHAFSDTHILRSLGLPPDKVPELVARMKPRSFGPNRVIVRQGDRGDSLLVIRSGSVRVTRREPDGKDAALGTLREGDFFGEMSLLAEGRARNATVTALEQCELLELHYKDLEEYTRRYPRFDAAMRGFVERRIRQSRRRY